MPVDWDKYHKDWKSEIRPRILKRENNCCFRCGRPNLIRVATCGYIWEDPETGIWRNGEGEICDKPEGELTIVKTVLTIAHLDHNTENNEDSNLRAYCQRHHLAHDQKIHIENRRKNKILNCMEKV